MRIIRIRSRLTEEKCYARRRRVTVADQGEVPANGTIAATNPDGRGGTIETHANTLNVVGAKVRAKTQKLGAPAFTVDQSNADTLARDLGNGTSVDAEARLRSDSTGSSMPEPLDVMSWLISLGIRVDVREPFRRSEQRGAEAPWRTGLGAGTRLNSDLVGP